MAYDEDCLTAMLPQNSLASAVYPACGIGEALSTWRCLFRIVLPGDDCFRPPVLDFGNGQSLPFSEIRLAQIVIRRCGHAQFVGYYSGGGSSALQRRAYDGIDARPGSQSMGSRVNLAGAIRTEGLIGKPAEPVFRRQAGVAMPQQDSEGASVLRVTPSERCHGSCAKIAKRSTIQRVR